eukprot:m.119376 g.119376  ORF g.119376 m.119376 type:complete len:169 (+) comp37695_c0_seq12:108-614(+)
MWRAFLWGDSTQKAQLSTKSSAVRRFSGESKNSNRELLSQLSSFYNKIGEVQIDDVVRLTKGKMENVIGWFRLRRNTKLRVSLRERAIHGSLIHYLTHAKCTGNCHAHLPQLHMQAGGNCRFGFCAQKCCLAFSLDSHQWRKKPSPLTILCGLFTQIIIHVSNLSHAK